jgi:membrane-bound lytic murein transglycosylase A
MRRRTVKLSTLFLAVVLAASCSLPRRPDIPVIPAMPSPPLVPVLFDKIEGWQEYGPGIALDAFRKSCIALGKRPQWQQVCTGAADLDEASGSELRTFFENNFTPYELRKSDGSPVGLATGYYVPDLHGSREPSPEYPYPLYRRPDDLLVINLGDVYPELAKYRLRGRQVENRILPYWDREAIEGDQRPLEGYELLWIDDPVELFFLHIQGSGIIRFEDGSSTMVNYADQNGHPFRSLSKWLIKRGIMTRDQMSMQNIKSWVRDNPSHAMDLLNTNPSYVFFRESSGYTGNPPGALGVPLTPGRSVAVDRRYTPLGAPVFIATTWPNSDRPLYRLMMAQDTGGAIKGPVRADFFWGMGDAAGSQAGRMKQPLRMWVLLPRDVQN